MMRKIVPLMTLTALATLVAIAAPPLRSIAQQPAQEETRAADLPPAPFNPQMSALMNMLIQPRHAKLGLAGKAENWPLAGYAFAELKQGVAVISRAVPRWKGLPVPDLFDAALSQPFAVLDFAIKAGEPGQFGQAYERLTQGCNNCHATMDHSYVVIKAPDGNGPFPNQEFKPPAR
jgi:hypothetical protein